MCMWKKTWIPTAHLLVFPVQSTGTTALTFHWQVGAVLVFVQFLSFQSFTNKDVQLLLGSHIHFNSLSLNVRLAHLPDNHICFPAIFFIAWTISIPRSKVCSFHIAHQLFELFFFSLVLIQSQRQRRPCKRLLFWFVYYHNGWKKENFAHLLF